MPLEGFLSLVTSAVSDRRMLQHIGSLFWMGVLQENTAKENLITYNEAKVIGDVSFSL